MTHPVELDRRRVLGGALAAGALGALGCGARRGPGDTPAPQPAADAVAPPAPLRLLILGGTKHLGPHVVDAALARGHTVTLFNRGKTNPLLYPDLEKLHGDRDGDLDALRDRRWDVVVDTSGYLPRHVKLSAELLAPSVGQYIFISSISVYPDAPEVGMDETYPVATMPDPTREEVMEFYGPLKALCEQAAEAAMPGRVTNIRPGLIVGPLDTTGRFTHWPARMADGGEVLAPGDGTTPVQWIDGRDLGAWIVRCGEASVVGVYNALGPRGGAPVRDVLEACNRAAGGSATLTWVDEAFLEAQQVTPWGEMPMWIPAKDDYRGFGTYANARAEAAGLTFRSIEDTARDTLAWLAELEPDEAAKVRSSGITREREAAVLAAWHARAR